MDPKTFTLLAFSYLCVTRGYRKKKEKKNNILEWISNLFFISPVRSHSARRIAIGNDWDLSGRGRRAQSFFTAQFPWCSFKKKKKKSDKTQRREPCSLFLFFFSLFFLLILRARSVSDGFKKGTVMITCRVVTHLFRLARAGELVRVRFLFSLSCRIKRWRREEEKKETNEQCAYRKGRDFEKEKQKKKEKWRKANAFHLFLFTAYPIYIYIILTIGSSCELL